MNPKPHPSSKNPRLSSEPPVAAAVLSGGQPQSCSGPDKNPTGQVFSLPESEIEDGSIEAGLLCLSHWAAEHPGVRLDRATIAHVCGCSEALIGLIERRALRRIWRLHAEMLREQVRRPGRKGRQ